MQESRPILGPPMDIDWFRRRTVLNRMLLIAALAFAVLGVTILLTQPIIQLDSSLSPAIALIISAIWLLGAYIAGRVGRSRLSGWIIVSLGLAWFALLMYMLPAYTLSLLPIALLPVALAVLLLSRRAVAVVSALTIGVIVVVALGLLPAPILNLSLPLNPLQLGLLVTGLLVAVLALTLMPLRHANTALSHQLAQREADQERLVQERRAIEQDRDTAVNTLGRQRQHLEALAEHIRDGVISVDSAGTIVQANGVARQLYAESGRDNQEPLLLASVETALEFPHNGTGGSAIVPLPAFGLAPGEAFTHVLLDRREEARLMRLRGELLGLLTDEMRNPLTSMVTALDLTLGQNNIPEEIDRVLIGARQSGQRLLELVTVLLEISQIEQNPDALRRTNTALSRVIEAGIAQMSPLAQRGAVTVSVEHAGDSVITIDGERVQRAFCYLLEQALRQSPPYSIVQVRTRRADNQLIVQITDQGSGRATQQNEQIFRQGGEERNASSLGLIYSKLIVEAHGGRVWAESNGGQGSSYSFALPLGHQEVLNS